MRLKLRFLLLLDRLGIKKFPRTAQQRVFDKLLEPGLRKQFELAYRTDSGFIEDKTNSEGSFEMITDEELDDIETMCVHWSSKTRLDYVQTFCKSYRILKEAAKIVKAHRPLPVKAIILEGYLEDQGDEPMIELKVEWLKEMIKELKEL